jgi:hypothetical protein
MSNGLNEKILNILNEGQIRLPPEHIENIFRVANRFPNINEKQLQYFVRMEQELARKELVWDSHYNFMLYAICSV